MRDSDAIANCRSAQRPRCRFAACALMQTNNTRGVSAGSADSRARPRVLPPPPRAIARHACRICACLPRLPRRAGAAGREQKGRLRRRIAAACRQPQQPKPKHASRAMHAPDAALPRYLFESVGSFFAPKSRIDPATGGAKSKKISGFWPAFCAIGRRKRRIASGADA